MNAKARDPVLPVFAADILFYNGLFHTKVWMLSSAYSQSEVSIAN